MPTNGRTLTLTLILTLTLTLTRDAAFHDFAAHAEQLLRWNETGAIRIQVRL